MDSLRNCTIHRLVRLYREWNKVQSLADRSKQCNKLQVDIHKYQPDCYPMDENDFCLALTDVDNVKALADILKYEV